MNKQGKILVPILMVLIVGLIWISQRGNKELDESIFSFEIDNINLEELHSYNFPLIIDFGSEGCGPCRIMAPDLVKVNELAKGKALVKYIDVWKYPEGAIGFPIQVIPTQVFYTSDNKPYTPRKDIGIPFTLYSNRETNEHVFTVHQGILSQDDMLSILEDMGVDL